MQRWKAILQNLYSREWEGGVWWEGEAWMQTRQGRYNWKKDEGERTKLKTSNGITAVKSWVKVELIYCKAEDYSISLHNITKITFFLVYPNKALWVSWQIYKVDWSMKISNFTSHSISSYTPWSYLSFFSCITIWLTLSSEQFSVSKNSAVLDS